MLCTEWMSSEADRGWVKAALDVMRKVKACDKAAVVKQWLCVPVPVHVVPDYPKVIFHPQDLGTIEAALKDNGFASPDAWIAAMRTVFRNVDVYNKPDGGIGSLIISAADSASQVFEKEILRCVQLRVYLRALSCHAGIALTRRPLCQPQPSRCDRHLMNAEPGVRPCATGPPPRERRAAAARV